MDFPSGAQLGAALGASVHFARFELALAYSLRYMPSVSVSESDARVYQQVPGSPCQAPYTDSTYCHPQLLGQPSPAVNAGTYAATTHIVALDLVYRFGP